MRRSLLPVLWLLACAAPAAAQRKVQERFAVPPDGPVRIQNIAGSVKVTGWQHDSIVVMGMVYDPPGERFKVFRGEGGVKIAVWDALSEKVPPSQLEIYVPARSHVWVRTASSAIAVGGVTGGVDVNSVSGIIDIAGSPRELFAESMSGELVLDVRTAVLRAKTLTGAIRMRGAITDASATSVGGNITVEGAVERGRFEAVDGDVRYIGAPARTASLDFVNHAGAVELLLPATAAADFVVSTHEGALDNEFRVVMRTVGSKLKGSEFHFALGSGGARVNVRTFRGRVTIRRR